jgi:hypothetical protein
MGKREEASQVAATLISQRKRGAPLANLVAMVYAGLGDTVRAFRWLDTAVAEGKLSVDWMAPTFKDLRADPRFDHVRRELGLVSP